jgi:predicted enzyme related to lactoylglutathione lyase
MKRVTGLGGIFLKANNPEKIREWYKIHLGIESESWGAQLNWGDETNSKQPGYNVWNPFKADTTYFEPSDKQFMINFRVENLKELVSLLKIEGIEIIGEMIEDDFGTFAWILDPEGNKLELWEPPKI